MFNALILTLVLAAAPGRAQQVRRPAPAKPKPAAAVKLQTVTGIPPVKAVIVGPSAAPHEVEAAKKDYALRYQAGENPRYLNLGTLPPVTYEQAQVGQAFWLPHLSLGSVLDHQVPQQLPGTKLWRIDLDRIGWGTKGWQELAKEYPYSSHVDPLIIRADWLLQITSDETLSDQYSKLTFARFGVPKNRAEWLKALKVNTDDFENATGITLDKGKSGVSKDTRLIVHTPTGNGNHFETFDSAQVFGGSDPLETLNAKDFRQGKTSGLKFQASEKIGDTMRFSSKTGERCSVQVYFLTDGQDRRIVEADTKIVEDKTHFRDIPSIRNPGSCVSCHSAWNGPKENTLRTWIGKGVEVNTLKLADQIETDQFYLSELGKIVKRGNEDFEAFCRLAAQAPPDVCVQTWRRTIDHYEASLGLEQAAREVYADGPEQLRNAIALYSNRIGPATGVGRLSSLAHGQKVSRKAWEGDVKRHEAGVYHLAVAAMELWREGK